MSKLTDLLLRNAFILSPTQYSDLLNIGNHTNKAQLEERHVLFMNEEPGQYPDKMFTGIA